MIGCYLMEAIMAFPDRIERTLAVAHPPRKVESGFAQLPEGAYRTAFVGNTEGWANELGELVEYLDAA
jgi:hypothetical protein